MAEAQYKRIGLLVPACPHPSPRCREWPEEYLVPGLEPSGAGIGFFRNGPEACQSGWRPVLAPNRGELGVSIPRTFAESSPVFAASASS